MSLPIILTTEAERDLAEARAYYKRQRKDRAEAFLRRVREALGHIRRFPEASTEVFPGVRRVVVQQFPYGIYYVVEPALIAVIAVYHSRRNPRGWQQRI